jgi:phosphoribosyl 1,2-cyclic phosphodiesterase
MKLCTLYSGSKGNSIFVSAGGANILIDAGKNAKQLCSSLNEIGVSPDSIDAIFITHEHTDHISALEVFLKKHPIPVHISEVSAPKLISHGVGQANNCLVVHPPVFSLKIKELEISSFTTPHDSMGSVGYRLSFNDDGKARQIGIATDIGFVSDSVLGGLEGCESIVLESNHDIEMLKNGPYTYELKQRILSRRGHLSNADCALLLAKLCAHGTKNILLAHLSEENNDPCIAYDEALSAISDPRVNLAVASPCDVTKLVWEE